MCRAHEASATSMPPVASMLGHACSNRLFRCIFSSKCLRKQALLPARYPPGFKQVPAQLQWLQSLVCNVEPHSALLNWSDGLHRLNLVAQPSLSKAVVIRRSSLVSETKVVSLPQSDACKHMSSFRVCCTPFMHWCDNGPAPANLRLANT